MIPFHPQFHLGFGDCHFSFQRFKTPAAPWPWLLWLVRLWKAPKEVSAARRSSYSDFTMPCLQSIVCFCVSLSLKNAFLKGRQDSGQPKLPCYDFDMPNLFSNYSSDILKINLALRKFVLWRFQRTKNKNADKGRMTIANSAASPCPLCDAMRMSLEVSPGDHQAVTLRGIRLFQGSFFNSQPLAGNYYKLFWRLFIVFYKLYYYSVIQTSLVTSTDMIVTIHQRIWWVET